MNINEISGLVIDAGIKVHSALGPGLLEQAYQACLRHELLKFGLATLSEISLPVFYDNVRIDLGYRIDLLVEDSVIVELKTVAQFAPIHKAQLLTYLKLSRKQLGLLLNFNTVHFKDGIMRVINSPSASSASSAVQFFT